MPKVLVIDDNDATRLLCRVNLELEGFEVLEAADGTRGSTSPAQSSRTRSGSTWAHF